MIPKKIHYCWFGGNPLDDMGQKCKSSWKKYFPDYEIIEWNETNFDVNSCNYTREAYSRKKWAFVSDYARFKILYENGGLYFDTDVEVIKDFSPVIKNGAFMGAEALRKKEKNGIISDYMAVNPGLGLAAEVGHPFYKEILKHYENSCFVNEKNEDDLTTVVERVTDLLMLNGLESGLSMQKVADVTIYPPEYFSPMDMASGKIQLTENTYSIHHFAGSWCSKKELFHKKICRNFRKVFGEKMSDTLFSTYANFKNKRRGNFDGK